MALAGVMMAIACRRCGAELKGAVYEVRAGEGRTARCVRCSLLHPPLVVRSLIICLIVGTVLTAINQGNVILGGDLPASLAWKVPLTYAVPYCVATTGAILNARSKRLTSPVGND